MTVREIVVKMRLMFGLVGVMLSVVVGCQGVATEQHTVSWIVDGDTFYVDDLEESVRIANVDAWEVDRPGGREAKSALIDLLYEESVVLDCSGLDVYGRHLCDVSVHGVDVGDWLVVDGYAREWSE